ncbi:hypothetical protein [Sphingomonas sp.]|uniref:hypothetical protein n=1 Tax=Sphingomonas sp. TaxID=28214 RepID=UPI0017E32C9F|nr:hypothetical protein [Sphingomonas sp.]MBA3510803.1 hypothetical protein [Sphingomonas sp.]
MLILILATVGAATPTAVDAERAFSRDAQRKGQWTASRAYADPDAVMFTPRAIWARDFLKGRKDPRTAIRWSPNASYVSCDGRTAVNTGPWTTADGRQSGFFTTVWQQEKGQWRWISDGRHTLKKPLAARKMPIVRKGSCRGRAPGPPLMAPPSTKKGPGGVAPDDFGRGHSADRTLGWDWRVGPSGVRRFRTYLWTGRAYTLALSQTIGGK